MELLIQSRLVVGGVGPRQVLDLEDLLAAIRFLVLLHLLAVEAGVRGLLTEMVAVVDRAAAAAQIQAARGEQGVLAQLAEITVELVGIQQ